MADETKNPASEETADIQEPESGLEETAEPVVDESGTEAVQPEKDTATEKAAKETKEKGVDLNKAISKLSPAEQKAYKAYQADYTKKAQSLSEHEKKVEQYEKYYQDLIKDPDFIALQKSKAEKAKAEAEPDFSKMSEEEIFNWTVDKRVQDKLSELETKMDSKYGTYISQKQVAEGNKMIADFAKEKAMPEEDVRELAKYAVEHRVSLNDAYKVANYDNLPEQAKQQALEDLNLKKKANLEQGNVPSAVAPITPEKLSFDEAAKLAEKSTGLKWAGMKTG